MAVSILKDIWPWCLLQIVAKRVLVKAFEHGVEFKQKLMRKWVMEGGKMSDGSREQGFRFKLETVDIVKWSNLTATKFIMKWLAVLFGKVLQFKKGFKLLNLIWIISRLLWHWLSVPI